MVEGFDSGQRKIYKQKPHITLYNYFSGEKILTLTGENGFGNTMTCQQDHFPSSGSSSYLDDRFIELPSSKLSFVPIDELADCATVSVGIVFIGCFVVVSKTSNLD